MEPAEVNAAIGAALKQLRQPTGVGQVELAARLDIDQTTVSRWERGLDAIPAYRIVQVEDALGLSRGVLWAAAGLMGLTAVEQAIYADAGLTAAEKQLVAAAYETFRKSTDTGRGRGGRSK